MIVNSSRGGGSKDTWVLEDGEDRRPRRAADGPITPPPALPDLRYGRPGSAQQQQQQQQGSMLARIAHELFWLGRNLARAEHTARMLDGVFQAELQGRRRRPRRRRRWDWCCAARRMHAARPTAGDGRRCGRERGRCARSRSTPTTRRRCVACVARAREGARTVRDVISAEMWEAINTTHLHAARTATSARGCARARTRSTSTSRSAARCSGGSTARTMLRDEASRLPRRRRAHRVRRHGAADAARRAAAGRAGADERRRAGQALALLQAVGGFQAYRRAVPAPPNALPVARFLLFERTYPDSVAASVDAAARRARAAPTRNPRNSEPVLRLQRLSADLEFQRRAQADGGDLHAHLRARSRRSWPGSTATSPSATSPAPLLQRRRRQSAGGGRCPASPV